MKRAASIRKRTHAAWRESALPVALRLCWALDSPGSLHAHALLSNQQYRDYAEHRVDPAKYAEPLGYFCDAQAFAILSKFEPLKTGIDKEAVAKQKFLSAEDQCLVTNARIRSGYVENPRVAAIIAVARRKIAEILGPVPSLADMTFKFGPGATFGVRGETTSYNKLVSQPECTYAFQPVLQEFLEEFPGWFPEGTIVDVSLTPGSELTFVPKNAKTYRSICIEPTLNALYQKGCGTYLRSRLKRWGVDLDNQQINQYFASAAKAMGLCTVDFSSASDTIAYLAVMELLPIDWFEFLEVARCPRYKAEGNWYNFQKFSSMGNAYTFELETLIFFAVAKATAEVEMRDHRLATVSVYGDDVIISQHLFTPFLEACEWLGFTINLEKTFTQGSFFESCGSDYFDGILVRPTYFKDDSRKVTQFFYFHNSLLRIAHALRSIHQDHRRANRVDDVRRWLLDQGPRSWYLWGPEGYGDGHLVGPLNGAFRNAPNGWQGWVFNTLVERPRTLNMSEWPTSYALYHSDDSSSWDRPRNSGGMPSEGAPVRGRTIIKKVRTICFGHWNGLS